MDVGPDERMLPATRKSKDTMSTKSRRSRRGFKTSGAFGQNNYQPGDFTRARKAKKAQEKNVSVSGPGPGFRRKVKDV